MSLNNDTYAAALAEIEEGRLDKGTWARAFAESGGDESKAKALYIRIRAEAIGATPAWSDTRPPVESMVKKRPSPKTDSDKDALASEPVEYYKTALGEKNLGYYLDKFHAFDQKGPGLHASWNWAAFFFTGLWALYRKMYGWFVAWVGILAFFGVASRAALNSQAGSFWVLIANFAVVSSFAAYANSIYHRKIKQRITATENANSDAAQVNRRLSSGAGVHTWVAYIFGGLPVVGILAAIALPAYQDYTKRQTAVAHPPQIKEQVGGVHIDAPSNPDEPPPIDSKGWTQETTNSTTVGPWIEYSPAGTRYYRTFDGTIYRLYPPGVKPNAEPANPFGFSSSTLYAPPAQ